MKSKFITPLVIAAALVGAGATAVAADEGTPAQPSTPAPTVQMAVPAPAVTAPTPNQVIYVPRLPTAQELTNAASAQNVGIDQIVQSGSQITVVYKYSNGQTSAVAYQILPAAGTASSPTTPPGTVVYQQSAPQVVYYSDPYYPAYYPAYGYYPGYWYPGVGVSVGFGYRWGGHFHGGFHGGGRHW